MLARTFAFPFVVKWPPGTSNPRSFRSHFNQISGNSHNETCPPESQQLNYGASPQNHQRQSINRSRNRGNPPSSHHQNIPSLATHRTHRAITIIISRSSKLGLQPQTSRPPYQYSRKYESLNPLSHTGLPQFSLALPESNFHEGWTSNFTPILVPSTFTVCVRARVLASSCGVVSSSLVSLTLVMR